MACLIREQNIFLLVWESLAAAQGPPELPHCAFRSHRCERRQQVATLVFGDGSNSTRGAWHAEGIMDYRVRTSQVSTAKSLTLVVAPCSVDVWINSVLACCAIPTCKYRSHSLCLWFSGCDLLLFSCKFGLTLLYLPSSTPQCPTLQTCAPLQRQANTRTVR